MDGRRQAAGGRRNARNASREGQRLYRLPPHSSRLTAACQRGFTLVEVLLAITLLGIIMVLAYQGLRTGARTAETGEAAIERVNRMRLAQEFIRARISQARPSPFDQDDTLGGVVFEGGPESLRFAAPMPGYLSYGGPYVQTLALVDGDEGKELIFDFEVLRYGPDADTPPLEDRDPVLLVRGLADAKFSYLAPGDSVDAEPEWVDEWRETAQLPLLVRIEAEFKDKNRRHWPALTVAPRVDAGGLRGFSGGMEFGPAPPPGDPNQRRDRR